MTASYTTLRIGLAAHAMAFILKQVLQPDPPKGPVLFFVEATGVVIFGAYWLVKSKGIEETHAELHAAEGHLETSLYRVADIFNPISVRSVEHSKRSDHDD